MFSRFVATLALQNVFRPSVESQHPPKLLCTAFVNHKTEKCNPYFQQERNGVWTETRFSYWHSTFHHQDSHFIINFRAARYISESLMLHVGNN